MTCIIKPALDDLGEAVTAEINEIIGSHVRRDPIVFGREITDLIPHARHMAIQRIQLERLTAFADAHSIQITKGRSHNARDANGLTQILNALSLDEYTLLD